MEAKLKIKKSMTFKNKRIVGSIIYNAFMILLCITLIYPFLWTFASAFKTNYQIYHESALNLIPNPFTFDNFIALAQVYDIGRMVFNGLYLALVIPLCSIFVSSMAAFALARLRFKGSNIIFILLLSTMMIPSYVTLIPNFAIMVKLGLLNSHWALILRAALSGSATAIFLFRQYFLSIPKDLENAAIIDGCSWAGVFFRIVLPNSKPVLATVAILSFRGTWNAYLWPSIILQNDAQWTWTLGLKLLSEWETSQSILMAGSVISILPILIIYIIFQRQFVNTQMSSGFTGT
ncbi:MAG: carbohydrate ABC transporter permease [Bacilli bacterium]|nr:carbohydrate ABC transporter permease [Bacilli bacterium]